MPKGNPHPCVECGKPRDPSRTRRGKPTCYECGKLAYYSALDQMKRKEGPVWDRWVVGQAAGIRCYLEAVLDSKP